MCLNSCDEECDFKCYPKLFISKRKQILEDLVSYLEIFIYLVLRLHGGLWESGNQCDLKTHSVGLCAPIGRHEISWRQKKTLQFGGALMEKICICDKNRMASSLQHYGIE